MELLFPSADPQLSGFDAAAEVLNRFHWDISVDTVDEQVRLWGGELLIARFQSMGELESFTAGMALALSILPEETIAAIDQWVGE